MRVLIVRQAFADYSVGAVIKDPAEIAKVTDTGHAQLCTPTDVPEDSVEAEPAPQADPPPAKTKA